MCHSLRHRVNLQIDISDEQDGSDQDKADNHHQDICVTGRSDERWQVVRRAGMK